MRPIFEENFYNLTRAEKYDMIYRKSLEIYSFIGERPGRLMERDINNVMKVVGAVLGPEKILFTLHTQAFKISIDMWCTDEQREHWMGLMDREPGLFGTYIQTELGHGTFVRGMETTATYDRQTQEFVLHSPTLTSIKFWPGTAGLSANYGLVMAKLVIDERDHGVHAFVVQLRCLRTHKHMPGVQTGDIGPKIGLTNINIRYKYEILVKMYEFA